MNKPDCTALLQLGEAVAGHGGDLPPVEAAQQPQTLSAAGPGVLMKCKDITIAGKIMLFASCNLRNWKKGEKR